MRYYVIFIFILFFLCACSPQKEMQIVIPENISHTAKQLIIKSLPKIKRVCPGLNKYSRSLQQAEIIDDLNSEFVEYRRVTISFKVSDGKSDIPNSYRAWGHTCYMDISPDGKFLTITKDPCKSVFTDLQVENSTGSNLILTLQ